GGPRAAVDFIKLLRALPEEKKARGDALHGTLAGLLALFVLEPATAAEVPGLLRTGLSPDAVSPIIGALSGATTPEALHALTQIGCGRRGRSCRRAEQSARRRQG
ncbi:MAG TPA: hypothetical protein VM686_38995, partial [Polyangiaceae bacterium]|nr:hypothetical protein [Polyangiaceae bacterium]